MEIKITVLMDNNTYIDQYYLGEPAVSYYIEADGKRILFDTGYSDAFISNAAKMGIDLGQLDYIVLSHGHNDHTRGLIYLAQQFDLSKVKLIAHPDCFLEKEVDGMSIGAPFRPEEIAGITQYCPSKVPVPITEHCTYLGEIDRVTSFEGAPIGEQRRGDTWEPDIMLDDTALILHTKEGLFIVTGCSHSGICNITEYAKQIGGDNKIAGILGGFHLLESGDTLTQTISYLGKENIDKLYPCHCISLQAKMELNQSHKIEEVGVGMKIKLPV